MEDKSILGTQITASSARKATDPKEARLNGNGFWMPDPTKDPPHWLQVDFEVSVKISGIQIQGNNGKEWTKAIQVAYGDSENSLVLIIKDETENMVRKRTIYCIYFVAQRSDK